MLSYAEYANLPLLKVLSKHKAPLRGREAGVRVGLSSAVIQRAVLLRKDAVQMLRCQTVILWHFI